jgi:hypothetical protein
MAGDLVFQQQIGAQGFNSQLAHGIEVQHDGSGAGSRVPL